AIRGSWMDLSQRVFAGKAFQRQIYDRRATTNGTKPTPSAESVFAGSHSLVCGDSREVLTEMDATCDHVITDPPYGDNVNYAELSDLFYAWLREPLQKAYACFSPDDTPKMQEIIENRTRGLSVEDFGHG